jgi:hypothetical protein
MIRCAVLFCFASVLGWGCSGSKDREAPGSGPGAAFNTYWRQGKAELSRFTLSQNRYRGNHPGEVVQIFVTEDFLTDRLVKNERYTGRHSAPVLKLNAIHRFATGIYDYSVMTSVFSPIHADGISFPFKLTNSAQDWCGQSFMQVNRLNKHLKIFWNAYFELEGDAGIAIPLVLMEDGIWGQIRIDPDALPTGRFRILPALAYFRLMHIPVKVYAAEGGRYAYRGNRFPGAQLSVYRVHYPELQRTLEIVYESTPPYRIAGWEETHPSLGDKKIRRTVAIRTHTILSPYWQLNGIADLPWRDSLGVRGFPGLQQQEQGDFRQ